MITRHAHRLDPDALKRASGVVTALLLLWPLLVWSQFHPASLLETQNLAAMAHFLSGFVPPETSPDFLARLVRATLETLAIATSGMALAFMIATPLALAMTRTLSIARIGPGPHWRLSQVLHALTRALLVSLRGVPELVWALLFVRAFGLGPAAGVLALAITYGGMLAKIYAEILESSDAAAADALLEAGSGRTLALLYGLLPNAAQEIVSYTVYRWECAIRASVVMGFVGAGGLGQLMDQSMKMLNGGEAATILVVFLLLVLLADAISGVLRRRLA
ncbi:MAG TPA: ABC transporter permease subunit [Candidatus Eremiobacteraceae bacterium]|nr:ABC transporter permease subunit [Candidatus Eremiobacteraceae bacterium]